MNSVSSVAKASEKACSIMRRLQAMVADPDLALPSTFRTASSWYAPVAGGLVAVRSLVDASFLEDRLGMARIVPAHVPGILPKDF